MRGEEKAIEGLGRLLFAGTKIFAVAAMRRFRGLNEGKRRISRDWGACYLRELRFVRSPQLLVILILFSPLRERPICLLAHLTLEEGRPPKENSGEAEGLLGPAPEVEVVVVGDDFAVFEGEGSGDDIVDGALFWAKAVPGLPASAAGGVVGLDSVGLNSKVVAVGGEHLPHGAGARAVEVGEDRVGEARVLGVGGGHGGAVMASESVVEVAD